MNSGSKVSRGRERRGTRDSREHQLSDRLTGPAATCLLVPADTLNRAVSFYKGRRQARGEVPCSADCSLKGKQGGNSLEVQPLGLHFHCRGQPVVEEQRPCMPRGPAKKRKELEFRGSEVSLRPLPSEMSLGVTVALGQLLGLCPFFPSSAKLPGDQEVWRRRKSRRRRSVRPHRREA